MKFLTVLSTLNCIGAYAQTPVWPISSSTSSNPAMVTSMDLTVDGKLSGSPLLHNSKH